MAKRYGANGTYYKEKEVEKVVVEEVNPVVDSKDKLPDGLVVTKEAKKDESKK